MEGLAPGKEYLVPPYFRLVRSREGGLPLNAGCLPVIRLHSFPRPGIFFLAFLICFVVRSGRTLLPPSMEQ